MNLLASVLGVAIVASGNPPDPQLTNGEPPASTPATPSSGLPAPRSGASASVLAVPPKPRIKRRTAIGMTVGGAVATAGLIWAGGMVAADRLDRGDESVGRVLPIPWIGPFVAAHRSRRGGKQRGGYVAMGVEQLVATAVMSVGAVGLARHRQRASALGQRRPLKQSQAVGLVVGGLYGLSMVYALTAGLSGKDRTRGDARYGRRLLIPGVGGIAAAPVAANHRVAVGALTSSALQLGMVGLIVAGSIGLHRQATRRWAVAPWGGRGRGGLTATLRF